MKIAFLAPAGAMHRFSGSFGKSLHYAPLTLTTLAALVPEELEAEIVIFDETAEIIPLDIDADLICITAITGTASRCYRYADYYRSLGKTVVIGGVHSSMLPEEAAEHADAVITGFAEQTFPHMLFDYKERHLMPRYDQNEDFSFSDHVIPRRDLLKKKRYITMNSIEAVRGCSLPCTFCAYPAAFGKTLHIRPVHEVISEIEALNSKEILFPDVNLIANRAYAIELFTAMIPLKKSWFGLATSTIGIDNELVSVFSRSGCRGLLIGFESISQGSQKFIHKGVNRVLEYGELMKKLHDAGILVQGCFAFGGDDEDKAVFEKTVDMAIKTKIDLPRYSILTPFPKTILYSQLEEQKRIIERNWAMYDVEHCVFIPNKMKKEELEEGIEWAWREAYSYKSILKRLAPFAHSPVIALALNVFGYRRYANKFKRFTREVMTDNSDIPEIRK
jgi:radical SAM superfamily enzyme YgiQ (UPF0313 family)